MSRFVIGAAPTFIRLGVLVPLDGAGYEPVQTVQSSLKGTTTLNRRAVKRVWALPQKLVTPAEWVALRTMFLASAGPYWLWDGSEKFADAPEPFTPSKAAGWFVVLMEGISKSHPNAAVVSPTLNLREV